MTDGARAATSGARPPRVGAAARRGAAIPPETFFVAGAVTQYAGAALAVLLFASVPAAGVAWLRVASAAAVMAAWRRPWVAARHLWVADRRRGLLVLAFGGALALMNLTFYLAIERLPLGTTVAIEFAGPIAVAAFGSRTRRDGGALLLAVAGVWLLADVRFSGSPSGVVLALAAAVGWAAYIVLGHRVAAATPSAEAGDDVEITGVDALALGMIAGTVVIAPLAAPSALPAFADPLLLAACVGVGLLSSVVPYVLDQVTMARLPRARFAVLLAILPAMATVVGAVVLNQIPRPAEGVGIALVVVAVALRSHRDDG